MQAGQNLVLVDGSSLAFRAFFALFRSGLRRAADSMPTWAIYGFFNSLFDFIEKRKPDGMAVCFDLEGPTFRHTEFADYKANRGEMPDDLAVQWPIIKQGVQLLGIPLYEVQGFEADDVIGTVARMAEAKGINVQIFTGDHDAFQLVDNVSRSIRVLMPGKTGKGEILEYGRDEVFEKLGVWPEQVIDYKGLSGDTSDNIPGVKGVGPKTAVQLLKDYGTIEGVYEHLDQIKSASLKQKLIDGKESAFASQALATIRLDVPLVFDFEHCQLSMPSFDAVSQYFISLEFKSLVGRLSKILANFHAHGNGQYTDEASRAAVKMLDGASSVSAVAVAGASTSAGAAGVADASKSVGIIGIADGAPSSAAFSHAGATSTLIVERKTAVITPPEPELITTEAQLNKLVAELRQQKVFAFDLETSRAASLDTEIVGWSFAWTKGLDLDDDRFLKLASDYDQSNWAVKTAYIPVRRENDGRATDLPTRRQEGGEATDSSTRRQDGGEATDSSTRRQDIEDADLPGTKVIDTLRSILQDKQIGKIVHNAKSKLNTLSLYGIEIKSITFDPLLASYLINPDDKHSLKDQAERLLGYSTVRAVETAGLNKKQLTLNFSSLDKVATCAADDARIILELARIYLPRLDADQRYLLHEMELPLSAVLAHLEQNGVSLDLSYLAELSAELSRDLSRLEKEIYELAGHTFNINSTQQLQKVLFEELNLKSRGKTKTGYSTDASVLEALKDEHQIIARILEYRQLSKLRSTYVDSLPPQISARTCRLHGEFNQTVTSTGRLSSSNPNLQNIPIRSEIGRRIRRAFAASHPDSVILSADYSQIELRLLAHMSGDETLIDAFAKNQDIHARTAGEIFDKPLDQVTTQMRGVGKTLNFALVYQQGAYATAQDLGISNKEAQAFIDKYFSRYPKVRVFLNQTIEEARRTGYVSTLWGRKRYFRFLNDRSDVVRKADERAACNAPLQGSAADLMKLAMIRLDKNLHERGLKSKLILQVHDELVLEVPKSELDEVKKLVLDAMQLDEPLKVPLKVDIGVGNNWMDAK